MLSEILSLDFETASTADLRRVGAHTYARHPETMVLCLAWAFNDEDPQVWCPGQPFPLRIILHVAQGGAVRGWNVTFEWLIWNHVLTRHVTGMPELHPAQLRDTMAAAAYRGLPLALDAAAKAARVGILKDETGHRLMLQMCRPRSFDMFTGVPIWWHDTDAGKYAILCAYCAQDVVAERAIAKAVPALPPTEQRYWAMDLVMNARGVPLDTDLVGELRTLAAEASKRANVEISILTNGVVPSVTSTARFQAWLNGIGYPHPNLRKDVVAERLDDPACIGLEREALTLRANNAKTSTAKLDAMLDTVLVRTGIQRVRGMIQYHGAIRTGRWAGRLIQLQNMPRGTVKEVIEVIAAIERGIINIDTLELFYGPMLAIVSSALRACIAAGPGMELFVADFSQIEARVLCWLAGQEDMLDVFRCGLDPYMYAAGRQGSTNRIFGKVLVLALGYGMGAEKFVVTAKGYGITLDLFAAQQAVWQWREDNKLTRQFWWDCDTAAKAAIRRPGTVQTVRLIKFKMENGHLLVRLPSGHVLTYREARLDVDPVVPQYTAITYMGLNQYTRQWQRQRTWGAKIVENITQALARDVMAEACHVAMADFGLPLCLMVHDELIGETFAWEAERDLSHLVEIMRRPPTWGLDLPVEVVGWHGPRYRK